jgi:hypothetical protein
VRRRGEGGGARERCPCKSPSSGHMTCFDRPHPSATSWTPGGRRRVTALTGVAESAPSMGCSYVKEGTGGGVLIWIR